MGQLMSKEPQVISLGHTRSAMAPPPAPASINTTKEPEVAMTIDQFDLSQLPSEPMKMLQSVIRYGDAEAMMKVGKRALIMAGEGTVLFVPVEMYALGWAAKTFAARVESLGEAPTIDFKPVFRPPEQEMDLYESCCVPSHLQQVAPHNLEPEPKPESFERMIGARVSWGTGPLYKEWRAETDPEKRRELARPFRMTMQHAVRVEKALRDALKRGDGESLSAVAATVYKHWGQNHANLPELRALVWACKTLGRRCENGEFGSRMTAEEEAFIAELTEIAERRHALAEGEKQTSLPAWRDQIQLALDAAKAAPASDGEELAFGARDHLKEVKKLVALLEVDLDAVDVMIVVEAMPLTSEPIMKLLDVDRSGTLDPDELEAASINFEPVHDLELKVNKVTGKTFIRPPAFVDDAAVLLKRRRLERDIIEGVKERNGQDLRSALALIESDSIDLAPELIPPAKKMIELLDIEDILDDVVQKRDLTACRAILVRVDAEGAPKVTPELVVAARAMVEKLVLFGECDVAMNAKDVDTLRSKISDVAHGWWHNGDGHGGGGRGSPPPSPGGGAPGSHWYLADKKQLQTYQIALKRLTVLVDIQQYMEPLSAAKLQAAVDTAEDVKVADPLVDQAIEILKALDREVVNGEFKMPRAAGGNKEEPTWLQNPQFKLTFPSEVDSRIAKLSITMTEGGGGDDDADYFEDYTVHICSNPPDVEADEAVPSSTVVATAAYDAETTILVIDELPTDKTYYIVASTGTAGEVGPFKLNVICETIGVNMDLANVVKTGDLVLDAIAADDLPELERLMNMAKEKKLTRVHGTPPSPTKRDASTWHHRHMAPLTWSLLLASRCSGAKGMKYLTRRKKEIALRAAIESTDTDGDGSVSADELKNIDDVAKRVAVFQEALEGAKEASVPPSLIEKAEGILAQLVAVPPMAQASADKDWQKLDAAITAARAAKVPEATIAPYQREMLQLRAAARLRACLAKGEDGYTELQACYDAALAAEMTGADVDEAKRLLEDLKNAQRYFTGVFEKWMGGGKEKDECGEGDEVTALDATKVTNPLFVDNPQFKLTTGATPPASISVSVDKDGEAEFVEYAVHVVSVPAGAAATQVGDEHTVVTSTAYDAETASIKFPVEADTVYFIVASTLAPNVAGKFAITTIGVGTYDLAEVELVQHELKAAMKDKAFEKLPALVEKAEAAAIGIPTNPLVISAKLIGDIEKGWQAKDPEMMGTALSAAKAAKVDKLVLKTYFQRYKQLAIEKKLQAGLAGDMPLLLAAFEEAKLIKYEGNLWKESQAAIGKFKSLHTIGATFLDDQAAGSRKYGAWRENPTWKLTAKEATTVYIAVNEDGALDAESQKKLEVKKQKGQEKYSKAKDKMEATAAAAAEDEKNDELAANAKDAARIFNEMEEVRLRKVAKEEEGEEDAFSNLGVHVVKNARESWIPGVLSGYQDVVPDVVYGDDQCYIKFDIEANAPVFVVPSTFEPGEEGVFTLSVMANAELTLEEVEEFEGNMYKLKGVWTSSNQGPRSKKNGDKEVGAKFKPEKTWNKNPQFRVWLRDPESGAEVESCQLQLVLSTPVEGAEMGIHVMRNAFCQFYNEKVEVLADRYQKMVGKTDKHVCPEEGKAPEIAYEIDLDSQFEVKKNGCEANFPFFIVPSLTDKKMSGPFTLQVYSDKGIVIQMLDDEARKL